MDKMIYSALQSIDVADLTHDEWVQVGMALKDAGADVLVWDEWSRNDARYHAGECKRLWENSFNGCDNPVKAGSIIKMARDRGWSGKRAGHELDWNDEIQYDGRSFSHSADQLTRDISSNADDWNPVQDLIRYLSTIFDPNDKVNFVTDEVRQDEDGKWKPAGTGHSDRTASQLIASLTESPDDITDTICSYEPDAGAWIRINPVDENGVKDKNITKYRYVLVESDSLPVNEQYRLFLKYHLPIAALVYSGGKSLHAIVHIDADEIDDHDESLRVYHERVTKLYDYLRKRGIEIDEQNKNPARLSRMPGVWRGEKQQRLIATDIGSMSWQDWENYVNGSIDDLPKVISLKDYYDNPPALAEEIINGVLRMGHKMLIAGPSKSGKSFALIELCVCFASGTPWLGRSCRQGRVLYINFEIDSRSCIQRFIKICHALRIPDGSVENVDIWNLRGHAHPLDEMAPKIITAAKEHQYIAIIIDPIYKVITGDENNATDMSFFCSCFDQISDATGCAVIYCHHYAKGDASVKKAMDRPSGSGVFARDPDAQITISELDMTTDFANHEREPEDRFASAWRCEFTLREFAPLDPVNVWFKYPLHVVDDTDKLSKLKIAGAGPGQKKSAEERANDAAEKLETAYDELHMSDNDDVLIADVARVMGCSGRWVRQLATDSGGRFKVENSCLIKTGDNDDD